MDNGKQQTIRQEIISHLESGPMTNTMDGKNAGKLFLMGYINQVKAPRKNNPIKIDKNSLIEIGARIDSRYFLNFDIIFISRHYIRYFKPSGLNMQSRKQPGLSCRPCKTDIYQVF